MAIRTALAGIPVRDLDAAHSWYSKLLAREADAMPMDHVYEWYFGNGSAIQVFEATGDAGHASVTLLLENLSPHVEDLRQRGFIIVSETETESVRTAIVHDPDGNQIVFAQSLG